MGLLEQVQERRARVYDEARAFLDDVERRGEDIAGATRDRWDEYQAELDTMDSRIDDLMRQERREREVAEVRDRYAGSTPAPSGGTVGREDREVRDFVRSRGRATLDVRLGERRDLTVGTATAGGNTVPTSFADRLVEHMIETAALRKTNVQTFRTSGGEDLQVPKTTAHSEASIVAEGATIGEDDPAFGQVTLGAFKYGGLIQVSTELLTDSGVDLTGYLARQTGRAIGNASGAHFVTGTGSGQPRGVVTASTLGVTGGTGVTGAFTGDDLIDLYFSVIPQYRANGFWLMSDQGAAAVRKLKDANDNYLWERSFQAGEPPMILGRPVVIDPNVADPALDAKSVVFGDMSAYAIRDVNTVRFERSDDFAFANDLVTFRYLFRTDGDLVDATGAVKHFVGGAS